MTEAKTINLTINERLSALKMFDAFKGGLALMRILLEDVKPFPVTEEEWTKANLVKTPNEDGTEQWKWDDVDTKEITIQGETVEYLLNKIKEKSDAGEVTLQDLPLVSLDEKLK